MITVPDDFAVTTIEREGAAGREWIDSLPRLVKALCGRWGLVLDGPAMHGYLSLVVPVRRGDELCVLKVSWISEAATGQAAALSAWGGHGAVRLLEADPSVSAMLLERLDFSRSLSDMAIEDALTITGRLLRRHAINAPDGLRMLPAWATDISQGLPERWERYGRPMPRQLLDRAQELAIQLGGECKARLLVNYDLHYGNVLASRREPWLVVDPMVVVGDTEFGIAQLLWTRLEDIEAHPSLDHNFHVLTETAELEPALARDWTLVRCVDYWLWGLSVGLTYDPARCERIIDWLTAA